MHSSSHAHRRLCSCPSRISLSNATSGGSSFITETNGSEEDGVEMEFRDAFKEGRSQRAAREKTDDVPRKRRASHAADALSKACAVRAGLSPTGQTGGRARY